MQNTEVFHWRSSCYARVGCRSGTRGQVSNSLRS